MGSIRALGPQAGRAYAKLHEWILLGKLAPGEKIFSQRVADEIGISRAPVRDALRRLAGEGLLDPGNSGKCSVVSLSPSDCRGISMVREAFEKESARLCAEAGGLKEGVVSLDGTKMKVNASLSSNRTLEGLEKEIAAMLSEAASRDAEEDARYGKDRRGALQETGANGRAGLRPNQGHARAGRVLPAGGDGVRKRVGRDLRSAQSPESVQEWKGPVELSERKEGTALMLGPARQQAGRVFRSAA